MSVTQAAPIDPMRSTAPDRYVDDVVDVRTGGPAPGHATRTPHFTAWHGAGRVQLRHRMPPHRIDNDVAGLLADELFAPGWLNGSDLFERLLTGVVLSSAEDAASAWTLFYRNTLDRLSDLDEGAAAAGSLAAYAPVYRHAAELVEVGSVLELGSCFGFLSLLLADRARVTASDVTANTVRLLTTVAPRLGRRLDTVICDAARVPRPDQSFDTVLAVHLLEHLHPDHGRAVLTEMQRLAARRVIVAVPFEAEPTAAFGHVRVFDLGALGAMGRDTGWAFRYYEHHGGWLVLDRPG
jgi:SAM-dependent methyltransferase